MFDPVQFSEKFFLARQSAQEAKPYSGLCGFEMEWNLLDSQFRPLLTVGSGPDRQSFVDYFRSKMLSPWAKEFSQLEVFNWMIEWASRPYYDPRGAVYEARLLEGILINALDKVGREFGEHLYYWHGNLLIPTDIDHGCIPGSWNLAKRRYLERCVDLYGASLATAGVHANLSLPDPLFFWDFMHLSDTERGDMHIDDYKSHFYITATRLFRAFASIFIATSASTPFQAQVKDGRSVTYLTEYDSVRNSVFPNPSTLDLPDLYRSYDDYLHISYDLVRRGVRFGNNNWTPVRARSSVEPVERLILVTSDQLHKLYARGLYVDGKLTQIEEMAKQIEIQNLMARINLPMSRVEIRTDESGHSLPVDIANMTLKHLLLLLFYADPDFGRGFRYDREDIRRARKNEQNASRYGLRAEIENPLTGKPVMIREFLNWTLDQVKPLALEMGLDEDLQPLVEMANGAPNSAEILRQRVAKELHEKKEVPLEIIQEIAKEHEAQIFQDIEQIAETYLTTSVDADKVGDFLLRARDDVHMDVEAPIRFRPRPEALVTISYPDKTSEILDLAQDLIRIPSVTTGEERLEEVRRAATLIFDYASDRGLNVRYFDKEKYPALLISFPDQFQAPVMLSGHFDVVPPEPDDVQFNPYIEGDYLWGRGAADMKTVVATNLVWMKDVLRRGSPYPPVNLMLIGNEENGETEPMGTPHVLRKLAEGGNGYGNGSYSPRILIAGERTGEHGDELYGEICTRNRGVMRFDVIVRGQRAHTGLASTAVKLPTSGEMTERLLNARSAITGIIGKHFTLSGSQGWQTQARFPFIQVGTPGIYNVTADLGVLGTEIRPIPEDNLEAFTRELEEFCQSQGLELSIHVNENGIACDEKNPYLGLLTKAVINCSGNDISYGKKLPGTSARFAPNGQGVVWGQTGIGPHSNVERHFIPSILPYYQVLDEYAKLLFEQAG